MTARYLLFFWILAPLPAQTIVLHVTGQVQDPDTSKANFGRLSSRYAAADWYVSNNSQVSVKIQTSLIIQKVMDSPSMPSGFSILSPTSNASVVANAQGSSPLSWITRISSGLTGGTIAGQEVGLIPKTGWGVDVVYGMGALSLLSGYLIPQLRSHPLQSMTAMLPPVLALDPFGSESGMVLLARTGKKFPASILDGRISVDVQVQVGSK
jgi:hypothetical protein